MSNGPKIGLNSVNLGNLRLVLIWPICPDSCPNLLCTSTKKPWTVPGFGAPRTSSRVNSFRLPSLTLEPDDVALSLDRGIAEPLEPGVVGQVRLFAGDMVEEVCGRILECVELA